MAVGVALSELRRRLRAEVGQSLNTAQGVNAQGQYDLILARQQEELWEQYQWPHLEARVDLMLSAGQTDYPYPAGVSYEAINEVWCWDGNPRSQPTLVRFQIPRSSFASPDQAWPVQFWQNKATITAGKTVPAGTIKVWPSPNKTGASLILIVQAPTNPLVSDTDEAVIDDKAIILFAAAEILAQQKNEGASSKLQKANQYVRRLLANQGGMKRRIHVLGGAQMAEASMQPDYDTSQRFRVNYSG